MSRIGKMPVAIPAGVEVTVADGNLVTVKGPKGTLTQQLQPSMTIKQEGAELLVSRPDDGKENRALHGLTRALLHNMVVGVTDGYKKTLEVNGVGYRAAKEGNKLVLNIGYSHTVEVPEIDGITIEVPQPNQIVVSGCDKQKVGQFAAEIREKRPPEPYKGKVDLVIDHHGSNDGFGKKNLIRPDAGGCAEVLYDVLTAIGVKFTADIAECIYIGVSTDTGCFVYSNVTANTHRVAAALMETGIDYKAANKLHFRTKSKKRLALEGELLRTMEFYDEDRVVIVAVPQSLQKSMALSEADMEDLASLGGLVEGTDCAVTMKETKDGAWKVSVRTGARVNATLACSFLGGGGHRAASGCLIEHADYETARAMILNAIAEAVAEEA